MSADPIDRHNEQTLDRLKVAIAEAMVQKIRSVLVRLEIPAYMDPEKNIYNSISYFVDEATGVVYVGSDLPYAPVIERGREPGKAPPHEPIKQWVMKKLGKSDYEADKIAWAIVHKIKNEGTRARYFMRISIEEFIRGV